jgi:hypothetical protein
MLFLPALDQAQSVLPGLNGLSKDCIHSKICVFASSIRASTGMSLGTVIVLDSDILELSGIIFFDQLPEMPLFSF